MNRRDLLAAASALAVAAPQAARARGAGSADPLPPVAALPPVRDLPVQAGWPDPLRMMDGTRVADLEAWRARRQELRTLFQHYMYGYMPPPPPRVWGEVVREDTGALGGKALLREIDVRFGPEGTAAVQLLLLLPRKAAEPAPAFLGINFSGNHAVLADPKVRLPVSWMPDRRPGVVANRATDAGRGREVATWSAAQVIERGYALATFYHGDIDPDRPDFTDGVHPHFLRPGNSAPGPHDWGTIAAWAWGFHRMVDYLSSVSEVDMRRIAVTGHSRNGKAALVAAAFDDRIAMAIPNQSGCGGAAPSRSSVGESVERINTSFPHWFNDIFPEFNKEPQRLPFDQHCLAALVAPRPLLFSNAEEDSWANPAGQFEMLRQADGVYRFLGEEGLAVTEMPPLNRLVNSRLGYFIRPGAHSMTPVEWSAWLDYADRNLIPVGRGGR